LMREGPLHKVPQKGPHKIKLFDKPARRQSPKLEETTTKFQNMNITRILNNQSRETPTGVPTIFFFRLSFRERTRNN
jgi:hypothetical protein